MSSTPSNSSLASLKNRRRNNQNSGSTATTSSQSGKGGSNFMKMYSDDTPGLKIDPVMVLVISLVFIGSVFILHIWELYCEVNDFSLVKEFFAEKFKIKEMAQEFLGETKIHKACFKGNLLAVKVLIFIIGVDVDEQDQLKITALQAASSFGHKHIVQMLTKLK